MSLYPNIPVTLGPVLAACLCVVGCGGEERAITPSNDGPGGATVLSELMARAEKGDAGARFDLGTLLEREGRFEEARAWYAKASEQGSVAAACNLGRLYFEGQGGEQNDDVALGLFQEAAKKGDARAQYNIGRMFAEGRGVPASQESAMTWMRLAADQGLADAQNHVGALYNNGATPNFDEAKAWYWKACKQGLPEAQWNLGVLYFNGQGVERDLERAFHWIYLSSLGGHEPAVDNLEGVEATLLEERARAIREESADWANRLDALDPR